jgi:hypothetical protein
MKHTKYILLVLAFVASFCQSQNIQYRSKIRPNVKAKLDSLYPHASGIILEQAIVSDTTQTIAFGCNCEESKGMIILTFDTNANLLNKDVHFHTMKDLPDTIINYIKMNTSLTCKFINNFMIKSVNNRGEIRYEIIMNYSPNTRTTDQYILKFKSNGELISKEEMPKEGL